MRYLARNWQQTHVNEVFVVKWQNLQVEHKPKRKRCTDENFVSVASQRRGADVTLANEFSMSRACETCLEFRAQTLINIIGQVINNIYGVRCMFHKAACELGNAWDRRLKSDSDGSVTWSGIRSQTG